MSRPEPAPRGRSLGVPTEDILTHLVSTLLPRTDGTTRSVPHPRRDGQQGDADAASTGGHPAGPPDGWQARTTLPRATAHDPGY
jgi:hypothetical protein